MSLHTLYSVKQHNSTLNLCQIVGILCMERSQAAYIHYHQSNSLKPIVGLSVHPFVRLLVHLPKSPLDPKGLFSPPQEIERSPPKGWLKFLVLYIFMKFRKFVPNHHNTFVVELYSEPSAPCDLHTYLTMLPTITSSVMMHSTVGCSFLNKNVQITFLSWYDCIWQTCENNDF